MKRLVARQISVSIQHTQLVQPLDLELNAGEILGLIGPNGAGKSSLLRSLGQLSPYRGEVTLDGANIRRFSKPAQARRIAYLAQGEEVNWPLTVRDFVALGRLPHQKSWCFFRRRARADEAAIDQSLKQTDLCSLQQRPMSELSGGERTRARLARVLAVGAKILLADEPVATLDPFHQLSVMNLLDQQREQGHSVVVVLHDLTLASRFCDQLILMHQGVVVARGEPRRVLTAKNLQQVYKVNAMLGEHLKQPFVVPWSVDMASRSFEETLDTEHSPAQFDYAG
jgi:iron complex transport system ATP-binding protein